MTMCSRSISAGLNMCWWTSIRTPTWRSIFGCACWRAGTKTSAVWAMMTSRSMAGGARKWAISLRFEKDFPGAPWCGWSRTTARHRHILAAAAGVIAGNENRLGKELLDRSRGGRKGPPDRSLGRRGRGALDRRRSSRLCSAAHAELGQNRLTIWRFLCAPRTRCALLRTVF